MNLNQSDIDKTSSNNDVDKMKSDIEELKSENKKYRLKFQDIFERLLRLEKA